VLILRLGLSDDIHGDLLEARRSWHISQEALARETGSEWRTRIIDSRPTKRLATRVEAEIVEHEPDLVFVACPTFWVSYPSVPLRLRRSNRIPFRRKLSSAGMWLSGRPRLAGTPAFHKARSLMTGGVGHAFFEEPEEAAANTEEALRAVLRHEHIPVAVRGPLPFAIPGPQGVREESERRRATFNAALEELCARLHIPYISYGPDDRHPPEELLGDRIHVTAEGHARRAIAESDVMIRAWRAHAKHSGD